MRPEDIKFTALYLRKSRGEDEDEALDKHRRQLIALCEERDWAYVEYAEIGTGDSIAARPKMQELLTEVEAGTFDAVVVVDYDRLGRGDKVDQATIEKVFAGSDTLIVTPQKIYDLNDESDMMLADFKGMIARQEYKMILKRLKQGKRNGTLRGQWTTGSPPFPYYTDKETKRLKVDENKRPVYRYMIELALKGYTTEDIAFEFNRQGIPSPKGGLWSPNPVYRLLTSEVHLGHIVANKRVKTSDGIREQSRDKWTIVHNCHEAVKTKLEHDKIMFLLKRSKDQAPVSRSGKTILSGLLRCAKCGHAMQTNTRKSRPNDIIRSCSRRDPHGNRCINKGGPLSDVLNQLKVQSIAKRKEIEERIKSNVKNGDPDDFLRIVQSKLDEIKKQEEKIERMDDLLAEGVWDIERYRKNFDKANQHLKKLEEEYSILKAEYDNRAEAKDEDRLVRLDELLAALDSPPESAKEMNRILKTCISDITWGRSSVDAEPYVRVNFL